MIQILFLAAILGSPVPDREISNEINVENVVHLMNQYRAQHGLSPLRVDRRLVAAAEDRMRHMEEEAYWDHTSPDGVTPFVWLRVRDYDYQAAGENLATGFDTAGMLVLSWMESPGHRDNILSAHYEECGIAIIDGSTQGPANGKSIVVLFGKPKPAVMVTRAR